ncbi:nuclear transport factor 2 family protein [Altererythrobacter sp. KTW20L]|uniref:nuclear transport factor 2 family protein n=1 Tax=Altererythrobacter sp. KTW20L TaxID=2942210 RepID=UPI0020C0126A|nr:nuclear transport factor 2 family protein [Altererythrobacter sp. KTW20L]
MAQVGSREWFDRYVAAFNARDYAGFGAYYAPQVDFQGQAAKLTGGQAIMDFYGRIHAQVDETVEVLAFVGSPGLVAAELLTTLVSRGDWPHFPNGPMTAGERRQSRNFAFYDIDENGLFTRIRTANFWRSAR